MFIREMYGTIVWSSDIPVANIADRQTITIANKYMNFAEIFERNESWSVNLKL